MASSSKKKKLKEMELQDSLGISRKKWKFTMSPKLFVILKLALIILIPIVYFVYSPLLILVMILYVSLFFLSIMAEHRMNKSVIRKNHLHFAKFDSAIALVVVLISIVSGFSMVFKKTKQSTFGDFEKTEITEMIDNKGFKGAKNFAKMNQYKTYFVNFCTLLTGERNVFGSGYSDGFKFGTMNPPDDFVENGGDFDKKDFGDFDFSDFDSDNLEMPNFDRGNGMFDKNAMKIMDKMPIEYVSNSLISTLNTVLIFSVSFFGIISLLAVYIRKRKNDFIMNEVILEDKIELLCEDELSRILSFDGEMDINENEIEENINKPNEEVFDDDYKF